jgi:hypothetical protein
MARGGRRSGSGRRPKSLAELQLTGGFRTTRHAHLLKPAFPSAPMAWSPDAAQLAAQGPAGRACVERLVAANELTEREGLFVLELGHVASALAAVRGVSREGQSLRNVAMLDRIELGWSRQFVALLAQLKVTP